MEESLLRDVVNSKRRFCGRRILAEFADLPIRQPASRSDVVYLPPGARSSAPEPGHSLADLLRIGQFSRSRAIGMLGHSL